MELIPSFNKYIEHSIKENWYKDALTDYKGATLQYHDVARKIEKLHILFENSGINCGDKIAICGRNSSNWAVVFMAVLTYGAVAVPIQNEFTPDQIYHIVNHSESKLLFVGDVVSTTIEPNQMPNLEGVVYIPDFSIIVSRSEKLTYAREHLNEIFGLRYPKYFRPEHIKYYEDKNEDLALINYTSGTTGFSKGVMLPFRTLSSNLEGLSESISGHIPAGSNVLNILPMAHMYGMMAEFILEFCHGNHLFFLTRLPSPSFIQEAMMEVKPAIVVAVPLILEKIIRKKIFPQIQNNKVKLLWRMPVIQKRLKERICQMVKDTFGGNLYEIIIGGAPMNTEIEAFLVSIDFPITMGYGTTETAPMITYSDWTNFVPGSCGTVVKNMEIKVKSSDPENIPGELITRGANVMVGYYKNLEATKAVLDDNGWYHTGDLATVSADGHVFIKGRIKNMLLGANGQNVYPEEIEDKLNSMAMVSESLIVQNGNALVGLVHPDFEEAESMGFSNEDIQSIMEQNRQELNSVLPSFCKLSSIKLHEEEFQKTPKKSIKRYLYQNIE
ncbi:AMP-binding enzyme [Prevotella sp. DNF00663]|uniref:AMP-binding protein n=1 Tax=unclassified Prevotella TaxID=2638335 RepID=UPI0005136F96|nr:MULTISPECIES: AMP-binding protein [unclassified Prevotella]KGI60394.1 long-chain fatty acid--CoA ligase [Prevotella sp. S7 MS 2]KXB84859.1 AMP-binding enzyme [Prevotella sp. DNF00663]